jgi:hypothetical protein
MADDDKTKPDLEREAAEVLRGALMTLNAGEQLRKKYAAKLKGLDEDLDFIAKTLQAMAQHPEVVRGQSMKIDWDVVDHLYRLIRQHVPDGSAPNHKVLFVYADGYRMLMTAPWNLPDVLTLSDRDPTPAYIRDGGLGVGTARLHHFHRRTYNDGTTRYVEDG